MRVAMVVERLRVACWGLGLGLVVLPAAAAHAEGLRIDAEYGHETGIWGAPRFQFVGAALTLSQPRGIELSSGIRLGVAGTLPSPSVAGFLRTLLVARHGHYSPAFGVEVEATSAWDAEPGPNNPTGSMSRDYVAENQKNWLRVATVAYPIRYRLTRFTLSAFGLRIATPLSGELGERAYVSISFFTLGYEP